MNEKNNKNHYLSLKDLISESLLRDLVLFAFLFLLIIAQAWNNVFLLLFPLITFSFSLFFRIMSSNKIKTEFRNSNIIYNPLGLETKHANRFYFCTLFQLILILWLGGESLYNPHIINNYFSYFLGFLIFFYTSSFFWIFIDLWKYSKIEIITRTIEDRSTQDSDFQFSQDLGKVVSYLKLKNFRLVSLITFLVFIILNVSNIITLFFMNFMAIGILIILRGSQIMPLSYIFYGFLIISPTLTMVLLIKNYKTITDFSKEKLDKIIEPLPKNIQNKIIENFKTLNNKLKEQLKSE